MDKCQLRTVERDFSSIVDGIREYDWNEEDLRCWVVVWYKSATDYWALTPTSEDALRDADPSWEASTDEGDPSAFYIASRSDSSTNKTGKLVLGFDVIPDTTTTGGYPKAVAYCTRHTAITGDTQIPYVLLDEMYFVYDMCEQWALESGDDRALQKWRTYRKEQESAQIEHVKNISANSEETRILPPASAFSTSIT